MAKVTMKSTKEEIMRAYKEAEAALKEQKAVLSTPGDVVGQAHKKQVLESAESDVATGMFSEEMTAKYDNLVEAIVLLEGRLQECYQIDAELADLTTVINAKKQAILTLDAELATARDAAAAEKAKLEADVKLHAADIKQAREREQSEYEYDLKRRRKKDADAHADDMAELEKAKTAARMEVLALTADADKLQEMERRIAGLDQELEAKFQEGVEAGKKEAGKEYGYKSAMADKDHTYETQMRDDQIQRQTKELEEKTEKITALEAKLDEAYARLRDLATKTVESSGGLKVIATGGDAGNNRK